MGRLKKDKTRVINERKEETKERNAEKNEKNEFLIQKYLISLL